MNKNEYFSNLYKRIIKNKIFHLLSTLFEYLNTLINQMIIFHRKFNSNYKDNFSYYLFSFNDGKVLSYFSNLAKVILIIIFYILIFIYYFIFSKFKFKRKNIINKICINLFEIFIFRSFFIFINNIIFSIDDNLYYILHYINNSNNIYNNKLNDYFSSILDVFHLIEKILLCISLQSSIDIFNKFLFIIVFIFQIISFLFCVYILIFKRYYIMNIIFLNKARFSFIVSKTLSNLIMILLGKYNLKGPLFLII